jgi:hypothetical protein
VALPLLLPPPPLPTTPPLPPLPPPLLPLPLLLERARLTWTSES